MSFVFYSTCFLSCYLQVMNYFKQFVGSDEGGPVDGLLRTVKGFNEKSIRYGKPKKEAPSWYKYMLLMMLADRQNLFEREVIKPTYLAVMLIFGVLNSCFSETRSIFWAVKDRSTRRSGATIYRAFHDSLDSLALDASSHSSTSVQLLRTIFLDWISPFFPWFSSFFASHGWLSFSS